MRTKAALKRAEALHTRVSAASASASPPPAAGPLTAAMIGWGSDRMRVTSEAKSSCSAIMGSTPPASRSSPRS